jgi:hypothetical protein
MKLPDISFNILNSEKHDKIKSIRLDLQTIIDTINHSNNMSNLYPFQMSFDETVNYKKEFYKSRLWLNSVKELFETLNEAHLNPEFVEYPWWNDITLIEKRSNADDSRMLQTELSHSYITQINKRVGLGRMPVSIISATCTKDNFYVMGSKSGAYKGKLTFIPSGSITLNENLSTSLFNLIQKQFIDELNIQLERGDDIEYFGKIYDHHFGKNYLLFFKTLLSIESEAVRKAWQVSPSKFEFLDILFIRPNEIKDLVNDMLEPAKICLEYIK